MEPIPIGCVTKAAHCSIGDNNLCFDPRSYTAVLNNADVKTARKYGPAIHIEMENSSIISEIIAAGRTSFIMS